MRKKINDIQSNLRLIKKRITEIEDDTNILSELISLKEYKKKQKKNKGKFLCFKCKEIRKDVSFFSEIDYTNKILCKDCVKEIIEGWFKDDNKEM
jgi:hypothetical protein